MPKIRNTKDKLNNLMDVLVANSERTNKSIESISEQISSLSDLLVAERTLSTKQYRKESILKQRSLKLETANKAFQDELDEIKSKRRQIQSEINSILEEERRIQKQERKAEQEKSTYYSRTAKSEFESGNLISGLFLSFLGRNEKTAEEIQEENKQADKEERDLRKKNLIDELTALKEERKQLRNDIKRAFSDGFKPLVNLTTSKSVIQENTQTQDMIYEMRDKTKEDNYNKQILDKITTIDDDVTKIEKSLLDLNKNINTTTSNSGIVDLLSSANQLKNLPRLLRPLTQILRPLMNVLSLPVLGGIAGAVASFSGFFSLLNKDQDLYNKRKEEEQKSKVESTKQQTAREDAIIRRDVDIEIQGIEARGTTITPDILESYAKAYEQKGEKKKALAYREKIKELKPKEQQILPPTAEEATYDAADYDMKLEKESEAVMVQSLTPSTATVAEKISEELPLYKAPVPTKLEQPTVQPTKTFVAKKQNVPTKSSISAPKVGVIKPNMEIGIIDRALGAIGSIIPTSFGSLGTPAMATTTPLVSPPAMSVPVSQAPVQSIQQSSKNITERLRSKLGVSIPAEALTGQALTETRGGKSTIGKFNFLNVTATPEQIKSGKYVMRKVEERLTPEQIQKYNKTEPWREIQFADKTLIDKKYGKGSYDEAEAQGKKWVKMNQAFASYDSMKEYEDAAVELFSRERYAKPLQSLSGSEITPKIFGETVGKAGFATADPKRYGETISSISSFISERDELILVSISTILTIAFCSSSAIIGARIEARNFFNMALVLNG